MDRARFKDAMWANSKETIVLGGAGGISSYLMLLLARTNQHKIIVYDFDTISSVNLGGQFYKEDQIGQPKTQAVIANVKEFCKDADITPMREYTASSMKSPIMIGGFDNMVARKLMYDNWKSQENRELYICPRLSAENYQIYFITPGREQRYESTLFTDDQVKDEPCTFKSTSHFAAIIGGRIVQGLNAYLANKKLGEDIYELPFFIREVGQLFEIKIQS
jgi:hypothetical protein